MLPAASTDHPGAGVESVGGADWSLPAVVRRAQKEGGVLPRQRYVLGEAGAERRSYLFQVHIWSKRHDLRVQVVHEKLPGQDVDFAAEAVQRTRVAVLIHLHRSAAQLDHREHCRGRQHLALDGGTDWRRWQSRVKDWTGRG